MKAPAKKPNKPVLLTKSKYIHGLNCPKYVWMEFNLAVDDISEAKEKT